MTAPVTLLLLLAVRISLLDNVQGYCVSSAQCGDKLACVGFKCVDPCSVCGAGTACHVTNHTATCSCTNSDLLKLTNRECSVKTVEHNCTLDTACIGGQCVNPCHFTSCGTNARCRVTASRNSTCECLDGYVGNAATICVKGECVDNDGCATNKACVAHHCVDPCSVCGVTAHCQVQNHTAICSCVAGQTWDPASGCSAKCSEQGDCPGREACVNQVCTDPCRQKLCTKNAHCFVLQHAAFCVCLPGYYGDPNNGTCSHV